MKGVASIFFVLGLLAAAPAELRAQTDGKFALGVGITAKPAPRADSRGTSGTSLLWRIGHGREGWGWKYGLSWYSTALDRSLTGGSHEFGELNIKPFLGGYGYTHIMGRTKVSTNVLAGYAMTSFRLRDGFAQAFRTESGLEAIDVKSASTWVVKPEVSAWRDLTRKVGLNLSVGYMIARPKLTVTPTVDNETRRVTADVFMIKVGAVYSIF
jgi:hypothetical protein